MASVEPKPYVSPNFPNPLGLKLELREQSPAEIQIFDIFLAYLPVDSQVSASDAAAQINQVLLRNTGNADLGDSKDAVTIKGFLWVFWDMYWLIGCQIDPALNSDAIDRQVALFGALKQLPSPVRIENGSRVWQDLPVMGMSITERWNQIDRRDDSKYRQKGAREWYNLNALLVKVYVADLTGLELMALQAIVDSLECLDKKDYEFLLEWSLPSAALWLQNRTTAAKLLQTCRAGECRDSNSGGYLWKMSDGEDDPRRGFSLQRWEFWRQRLEKLSRHRHATDRSREICRAALETMGAIAGDGKEAA